MAASYNDWLVNPGPGNKLAFRKIYEGLGCSNIHGLSKQALIEIALDFDSKNFPLTISDPDVEMKATDAQTKALKEEVDRRKVIAKNKKDGEKAAGGKTRGKTATAQSGKAQETNPTPRPRKNKARAQDKSTPIDGETPEEDQDEDVRMAEDQDPAEAAPLVDSTSDAVSSPITGTLKRKRAATTTSPDDKRARTTRATSGLPSLIVRLKLQTTIQGLDSHHSQRQSAGDMRRANTRRTFMKPSSRLQDGTSFPLELAESLEGSKNDPDDTVANGLDHVFGTSAPATAPGELPSRRQPPRVTRKAADKAVDDTSDDDEESPDGEAAPTVPSKLSDEERIRNEGSDEEVADEDFPRDKWRHYISFPSSGKIVCYLKEETEEEEEFYPYNLLSGPGQMRRLEAQERRKIKQTEEKGETYVPEPVKKPYDWTKHM